MKRLIVNADDFGLSKLTNKGIVECFEHGIVTSTTIMANGKAFDHAVKLAKKHKLDVGIHLNIAEGSLWRALCGKLNLKEVENKFRAQIEAALKSGIKLTHIDGHKHIHVFPKIINVVIKLAKEYKINKIRLDVNKITNYWLLFSKQGMKGALVNRIAKKAAKKFRENGLTTTGKFYGMLETGKLSTANLKKILKNIDCTAELMVHPGYYDSRLQSGLKESREMELRTLTSQEAKKMIKKENIKLISYKEL